MSDNDKVNDVIHAVEVIAVCAATTGTPQGTAACTVKTYVAEGLIEKIFAYITRKLAERRARKEAVKNGSN
jgi:hypothetical protein